MLFSSREGFHLLLSRARIFIPSQGLLEARELVYRLCKDFFPSRFLLTPGCSPLGSHPTVRQGFPGSPSLDGPGLQLFQNYFQSDRSREQKVETAVGAACATSRHTPQEEGPDWPAEKPCSILPL